MKRIIGGSFLLGWRSEFSRALSLCLPAHVRFRSQVGEQPQNPQIAHDLRGMAQLQRERAWPTAMRKSLAHGHENDPGPGPYV